MPEYFYFIDGGGEKGEMLGIKKNYSGYFKTGLVRTKAEVDDKNRAMGLSKADEFAMMYCSMMDKWDEYDKIFRECLEKILKSKGLE